MIGIFDSGLGGLIVFKEIKKLLPKHSYVYLGDNLRSPYGGRSQEAIYNFTEKATKFLFGRGCNLIIIACNTASSEALRKLQQEFLPTLNDKTKNILGVIRPIVEEASSRSVSKRIGVVGTRATINSYAYDVELKKINKNTKIFSTACPLLVPLIEEGFVNTKETKSILKKYLKYFDDKDIDILILGCTHYPILLSDFKNNVSKKVQVLDTPKIVAKKLKDYLKRHEEIDKTLKKASKIEYLATDPTDGFVKMSRKILHDKNIKFKKVVID